MAVLVNGETVSWGGGFLLLHQLLLLLQHLLQLWLMYVYGAYTVSLTVLSRQGVSRAATVLFDNT